MDETIFEHLLNPTYAVPLCFILFLALVIYMVGFNASSPEPNYKIFNTANARSKPISQPRRPIPPAKQKTTVNGMLPSAYVTPASRAQAQKSDKRDAIHSAGVDTTALPPVEEDFGHWTTVNTKRKKPRPATAKAERHQSSDIPFLKQPDEISSLQPPALESDIISGNVSEQASSTMSSAENLCTASQLSRDLSSENAVQNASVTAFSEVSGAVTCTTPDIPESGSNNYKHSDLKTTTDCGKCIDVIVTMASSHSRQDSGVCTDIYTAYPTVPSQEPARNEDRSSAPNTTSTDWQLNRSNNAFEQNDVLPEIHAETGSVDEDEDMVYEVGADYTVASADLINNNKVVDNESADFLESSTQNLDATSESENKEVYEETDLEHDGTICNEDNDGDVRVGMMLGKQTIEIKEDTAISGPEMPPSTSECPASPLSPQAKTAAVSPHWSPSGTPLAKVADWNQAIEEFETTVHDVKTSEITEMPPADEVVRQEDEDRAHFHKQYSLYSEGSHNEDYHGDYDYRDGRGSRDRFFASDLDRGYSVNDPHYHYRDSEVCYVTDPYSRSDPYPDRSYDNDYPVYRDHSPHERGSYSDRSSYYRPNQPSSYAELDHYPSPERYPENRKYARDSDYKHYDHNRSPREFGENMRPLAHKGYRQSNRNFPTQRSSNRQTRPRRGAPNSPRSRYHRASGPHQQFGKSRSTRPTENGDLYHDSSSYDHPPPHRAPWSSHNNYAYTADNPDSESSYPHFQPGLPALSDTTGADRVSKHSADNLVISAQSGRPVAEPLPPNVEDFDDGEGWQKAKGPRRRRRPIRKSQGKVPPGMIAGAQMMPHTSRPGYPPPPPGSYPTQPGYPSTQPAYPAPPPAGYPPPQAGYPPRQPQPGYPPQQPAYPPAQPGYPPAQPGYPSSQPAGYPSSANQPGFTAPPGSGYPPQPSAGYPPTAPGYPGGPTPGASPFTSPTAPPPHYP